MDKTCGKCKASKPATLDHFAPDKCSKSGLQSWCRICARLWHKAYQQTEHRKERRKAYRLSKKGQSAQRRADKRYRQTDKYRETLKRRRENKKELS